MGAQSTLEGILGTGQMIYSGPQATFLPKFDSCLSVLAT